MVISEEGLLRLGFACKKYVIITRVLKIINEINLELDIFSFQF